MSTPTAMTIDSLCDAILEADARLEAQSDGMIALDRARMNAVMDDALAAEVVFRANLDALT